MKLCNVTGCYNRQDIRGFCLTCYKKIWDAKCSETGSEEKDGQKEIRQRNRVDSSQVLEG